MRANTGRTSCCRRPIDGAAVKTLHSSTGDANLDMTCVEGTHASVRRPDRKAYSTDVGQSIRFHPFSLQRTPRNLRWSNKILSRRMHILVTPGRLKGRFRSCSRKGFHRTWAMLQQTPGCDRTQVLNMTKRMSLCMTCTATHLGLLLSSIPSAAVHRTGVGRAELQPFTHSDLAGG